MGKSGTIKGILVVLILAVVGFMAYYVMGLDKSHMSGIDFGNYSMWLLFFAAIAIFGLVLFVGIYSTLKPVKRGRYAGKIKYKAFYFVAIAVFFIGTMWCAIALVTALRGWNDSSVSANIAIVEGTSGDFDILSADVSSYHDKDDSVFTWTRFIAYDDKYQIVTSLNCTNLAALYNDTTMTIQGFNIKKISVTGAIAPEVQPGDFEIDADPKTVVFNSIPRQQDSPDRAIVYFNISLYDEDSALLSSWIVHTDPRLGEWTLDTTV